MSKEAPVGAWRSLVAHLFWVQGVASSNLAVPTIFLPEEKKKDVAFRLRLFLLGGCAKPWMPGSEKAQDPRLQRMPA